MWEGSRKTAIIGWGFSDITRDSSRPLGQLAVDACSAAIEHAGISADQIDGLATYPDQPFHGAPSQDGIDLIAADYVLDHLNLAPDISWYAQISTGMIASAIGEAVNALLAGVCDYALVWRAMRKPEGQYGGWQEDAIGGDEQFTAPWGFTSIIQTHAVAYQRYLHRTGAKREAMAALVTNSRRNANLNPNAIFRDRTMTVDDYLAAPIVADPLCLFDCDVPVQGCAALVITTADRARDSASRPAYILSWAQQTAHRRPTLYPLYTLQDHMALGGSTAGKLWSRAGLGPGDVNVAELYDGFSPSTYYWLEAAGFCGAGEAHEFVQDGRIAVAGGQLPVNTFGGSLSEGRLHGMGHVIEAARQVTGQADKRQVAGAEIAVAIDGSPMLRNAGIVLGK